MKTRFHIREISLLANVDLGSSVPPLKLLKVSSTKSIHYPASADAFTCSKVKRWVGRRKIELS